MFTVSAPESPHLGQVEVATLKEAIRIKHAWQTNQPNCHAIIGDSDGFVVSSFEQSLYLALNLSSNRPV